MKGNVLASSLSATDSFHLLTVSRATIVGTRRCFMF